MPAKRVPVHAEEIKTELDALSRAPFRDVLTDILGAAPSLEEMEGWAKRNPDRWGQLLAIVGKLAGYSDKLAVEGNFTADLGQKSDAEIERRLLELEDKLKKS